MMSTTMSNDEQNHPKIKRRQQQCHIIPNDAEGIPTSPTLRFSGSSLPQFEVVLRSEEDTIIGLKSRPYSNSKLPSPYLHFAPPPFCLYKCIRVENFSLSIVAPMVVRRSLSFTRGAASKHHMIFTDFSSSSTATSTFVA
ncbi:hypothetical protein VNO77_37587 [Canavalia gladiata]|uniref:Uncharacterized protein n=1 Tax=Canavalia gladiata TaxID=3824 RepID=A0AAN9PWS7_CANGL